MQLLQISRSIIQKSLKHYFVRGTDIENISLVPEFCVNKLQPDLELLEELKKKFYEIFNKIIFFITKLLINFNNLILCIAVRR